jgi:parallel beta-helix repeat protein
MTTRTDPRRRPRRGRDDLGLRAVERAFSVMSIDEGWSVREERGFTWWGHWLRQRISAGEATVSRGRTLWHLQARTPVLRGLPDEPATYELANTMNLIPGLSAYAYDADAGTLSARCGVLQYEDVADWLERWFAMCAALQASIAWVQGPAAAEGRPLDDEPHPTGGRRADPDDMLNVTGSLPEMASPLSPQVLEEAAEALRAAGAAAAVGGQGDVLQVALPVTGAAQARWNLAWTEHPVLRDGALVSLWLPVRIGPVRGAWLANALNLAETGDWRGEDRPHAIGAWRWEQGWLVHLAFLPGGVIGPLGREGALLLIQNLVAWGLVRAKFAGERLPWLEAAAAARHPEEEVPPLEHDGDEGAPREGDEAGIGAEAPVVPVAQRSFGPAARTPRGRTEAAPQSSGLRRASPRELVVDPAEDGAFREIDDAVAVAEDGDTIRVRPGTYGTPVVVDRAVTILGDGPREAIVLEPAGAECLGFAASGARVRGLTLRPARAANDGAVWSAVAVHDVEATLEDCHLTTHLGATVWVGGPSSRAVLTGCTLVDGAQNAVYVGEEGRAELIACRVSGHRWPLAAAGPHASLTLRRSEVVDNLGHGAAATERALLVVEGCTVARNAHDGVLLGGAAPASRVVDSTIEENGDAGVFIGATRGRVSGNSIQRNDVGIAVVDAAAPTVRDNHLADNRVALGVSGAGSDPRVIANTISGSRAHAVVVEGRATGRFEANTVSATEGAGIWVDDAGTAPRFTGNHVGGGAIGVLVTEGGGGDFRSNDLRGNTRGSWYLDEPGDVTREDNLEDAGIPGAPLPVPPAGPAGTPPPPLLN